MGTFTLSGKELHRPGLVKAVCGGRITNRQVAEALRLSVRQVRRLKRRFEQAGAPALVHRSRGRPSPRRLPPRLQNEVLRLMTTVYVGFNDTHLTEKLNEAHGLAVSRESVRRLRRALGRPAQRARRRPRARRRRVPEAARGSLVQIDGSPFAWFGAAAPPGKTALRESANEQTRLVLPTPESFTKAIILTGAIRLSPASASLRQPCQRP